jgi:hypothetical protein
MMHADRTATDLGDFTTTTHLIPITALAILIGVFAAYVAAALLKLIGLFTNLFFFNASIRRSCRLPVITSDRSSSSCRWPARS